MQRSSVRRRSTGEGPSRRAIVAVAAVVCFGVVLTATQVASAGGSGSNRSGGSNQAPVVRTSQTTPSTTPPLDVLARDCSDSELEEHDGFQNGGRCVETQFGELAAAENNPTLLIVDAPNQVVANQPFTIKVSTRNLVRDRFLKAAEGGYLKETSLLNDDGLVRGHFHTACRIIDDFNEAPDPEPVPAFFVATEDKKGGADPDVVEVQVPGLPDVGIAQCAVWAGDGSHRTPMMQRANQTPPIDSVRIAVQGVACAAPPADNEPPADEDKE
jgi:hypothetical protein